MKNLDIINSVDEKIDKVRTRSLDLSFNELLDMYKDGELIISPEYQRLFRWEEDRQSRFIESLVLEMPVPPIFVVETEENEYELIDGLQRISSYLHFRGNKITGGEVENKYLKLVGCDIVRELNGMTYNDLPKSLQIRLKRNFIRVEVLRKENDNNLRYYMFKRLNSGGEQLSQQEIRNCTIRLLDKEINDTIISCSNDDNFKSTIDRVEDEKINKKFDQELVLRFFALKNNRENYKHPFDMFLTNYMESVADKSIKFNHDEEIENFRKTFKCLNDIIGKDVFSTILNTGTIKQDFVAYYFDAFSLGIQDKLDELLKITSKQKVVLKNKFMQVKSNEIKQYKTGTKSNIINRVKCVENAIEEVLCN